MAEELTLLYEDDIHYNLIVSKEIFIDHQTEEKTTIFGKIIKLENKKSWAQVTEIFRPGLVPASKEPETEKNCKPSKSEDKALSAEKIIIGT